MLISTAISALIHAVGLFPTLPTSTRPTPFTTPSRTAPQSICAGRTGSMHLGVAGYTSSARAGANHAEGFVRAPQTDETPESNFHTDGRVHNDTASASREADGTQAHARADISVDMEIPPLEEFAGSSHPAEVEPQYISSTASSGAESAIEHPTQDHLGLSSGRSSMTAHVNVDPIRALRAENEALQGQLRANKRKLSELSAAHLASSERIIQLEAELRTAKSSVSSTSSNSSDPSRSASSPITSTNPTNPTNPTGPRTDNPSSTTTTPHLPPDMPQSQYEIYETAVRLAETRSALVAARDKIERLEMRAKVAREDRDVYRERARRMEEEVKRVKGKWDGEVRLMMDAMAERGLLVCLGFLSWGVCWCLWAMWRLSRWRDEVEVRAAGPAVRVSVRRGGAKQVDRRVRTGGTRHVAC